MKEVIVLLISFTVLIGNAKAQKVTIIESATAGHVMDQNWLSVVTAAGATATIEPQSALDNYSSFGSSDILIISSGVINIPANRVNNILLFLAFGGNVYLQSEYDITFSSDSAFQSIVNALGGSFNWVAQVPGLLMPSVSTSIATTPNVVAPLGYFWYGATGTFCSNIEPFMNYQGNDLGYIFCGTGGVGRMITTTDQDWVVHFDATDVALMENIFYNLKDPNFVCNAVSYPALSLGNDTTICPGDTLLLNAGGSYNSYQWQNGTTDSVFLATTQGVYWITVATPCSTYTDTITVGICGLPPTTALAASDSSFCDKHCINFYDLSTNNPTSWQWFFPGSDSLMSNMQNPTNICYSTYGSFDVTLIACNAAGCDTLLMPGFINEYQLPSPTITQSNDTLFSSPALAYQWWSVDSGIIAGATNSYYIPTQGGNYFVIVTDTIGCNGSSNTIVIMGVNELAIGSSQLAIVPNPNSGIFTINLNYPNKDFSIRIVNSLGQTLKSWKSVLSNGQFKFDADLGAAPTGLYTVELITNEKVYRQKFLKE